MFGRAIRTPGLILLRLYSWESGAITFGYNQDESKVVDYSRLEGTPLIRRVTGGRALYHEPSELTYAIAVNCQGLNNEILNGSISRTSRSISLALLEFLKNLDIKAHYVRQNTAGFTSPVSFHSQPCFDSAARNEIVGERGKIIASAQRRISDGFLQHGSIKINGVVHHPALRTEPDNSLNKSEIRRFTEIEFNRYAKLFSDAVGSSLGISLEFRDVTEIERNELAGHERQVKNNSIFRREPIRQLAAAVRQSAESHN